MRLLLRNLVLEDVLQGESDYGRENTLNLTSDFQISHKSVLKIFKVGKFSANKESIS